MRGDSFLGRNMFNNVFIFEHIFDAIIKIYKYQIAVKDYSNQCLYDSTILKLLRYLLIDTQSPTTFILCSLLYISLCF